MVRVTERSTRRTGVPKARERRIVARFLCGASFLVPVTHPGPESVATAVFEGKCDLSKSYRDPTGLTWIPKLNMQASLSRARSRANMDLLRGGFGPSVDQARLLQEDADNLVLGLAKVTDEIRRLTVLHE